MRKPNFLNKLCNDVALIYLLTSSLVILIIIGIIITYYILYDVSSWATVEYILSILILNLALVIIAYTVIVYSRRRADKDVKQEIRCDRCGKKINKDDIYSILTLNKGTQRELLYKEMIVATLCSDCTDDIHGIIKDWLNEKKEKQVTKQVSRLEQIIWLIITFLLGILFALLFPESNIPILYLGV